MERIEYFIVGLFVAVTYPIWMIGWALWLLIGELTEMGEVICHLFRKNAGT